MAAQPVLHLFPPVSHIEKRRDELDDLIKKSMELRPARPFIRAAPGTAPRQVASRSRTRAPVVQVPQNLPVNNERIVDQTSQQSTSKQQVLLKEEPTLQQDHLSQTRSTPLPQVRKDSLQYQHPAFITEQHSAVQALAQVPQVSTQSSQTTQSQQSYHPPPLAVTRVYTEPIQPTGYDTRPVKTGPLPVPPIDTQNLKREISRTPPVRPRPRRSSSARAHGSTSNASILTRASATISPASSIQSRYQSGIASIIDSPVTNPSIYGSRPPSTFKNDQSGIQYPQVNRLSTQIYPSPSQYSSRSDECLLLQDATLSLPPPPPPPPKSSRRSQTMPVHQATASPPRHAVARNAHRHQESNSSNTSWRGRQSTRESNLQYQASEPLSRSNTISELGSPESFYAPEKPILTNTMDDSIQSMFPIYDHSKPRQIPSYQSQRSAPTPPGSIGKHDSTSTGSRSSSSTGIFAANILSAPLAKLSTLEELDGLWNASNGQITSQLSGSFNLRMHKHNSEGKRKSKITFGPSESQTFYSLAQAHPAVNEEEEAHEALIFRHHTSKDDVSEGSKDDLLPISHMLVYPPPAPSYSKLSRHSADGPMAEETNPISTVTPVMATLHALDAAAKSPQAHALASCDPKAESPAAARLAERAVQAAAQRESCTLGWTRANAHSGKYELHHPSLGVFTVAVEGNVKAALASISSSTKARKHASITLLNPFASMTYQSPSIGAFSPTSSTFGDVKTASATESKHQQQGKLVKLDFTEELLHIDAPAIQSLGNVYLLDVAVATVLAVAIAESQRADDPGLLFAAPPPSLMLTKVKKTSRIFSSYSSSLPSTDQATAAALSANDKKNKKLTSASTVSLVQLVRGTNGKSTSNSRDGKRTIDWSRTNAIMGIEHLTDVQDLPRITRGILSVLGLGFKTALWLLEFGVRISAKMVIGLTKFADKV